MKLNLTWTEQQKIEQLYILTVRCSS